MGSGNKSSPRANKRSKQKDYQLKAGEKVYARSAPTSLNKEGKVMIIEDADGNYVYKGFVGDYNKKIDTNSIEYKRALNSVNVKAKFKADGSVEVVKGGLYSRKRTFKNVDELQKDANNKIDSLIQYEEKRINNTKQGILVLGEVHADNIKTMLRKNVLADAEKKIQEDLQGIIKTSKTNIDAYQNMKNRLNAFISQKKVK